MLPTLTEDLLRSLCTPQSFQRGREYYRAGAISQTVRQGNLLLGECEGSSMPYYRLRVELDENGIRSAACTCEYNWGGYCKHLAAFLLTYIHEPEQFIERRSLPDLLKELDREALLALLTRLIERDPSLYDWIETQVECKKAASQKNAAGGRERRTQVSEQAYRRQIKNILHSLDGYSSSERYWGVHGMVKALDEIVETARQFLENGDAEGALIILTTLLKEVAAEYEYFDDSDGDLSGFLDDLALPMAEAILTLDPSTEERAALARQLKPVITEMKEYGIERLGMVLQALERGWQASATMAREQEEEDEGEDWEEEEWEEDFWEGDLTTARLNVLDRQGRVEEYLALCRQAGEYRRYTLKLIELGRVQEAIQTALRHLYRAEEALDVARALREKGYLSEALRVGEHGLSLEGDKSQLGNWLGPQEETQGRMEQALQAYRAAFAEFPSLSLYQTLQRLSAGQWPSVRQWALQSLQASRFHQVLAEVHLLEQDWDAALQVAEGAKWDYNLVRRVAEALTPHRPEWVIRVCVEQARALIDKTQSKYYAIAADWLAQAKKAYLQLGREKEWQTFINDLRAAYSRRPALQAALKGL